MIPFLVQRARWREKDGKKKRTREFEERMRKKEDERRRKEQEAWEREQQALQQLEGVSNLRNYGIIFQRHLIVTLTAGTVIVRHCILKYDYLLGKKNTITSLVKA